MCELQCLCGGYCGPLPTSFAFSTRYAPRRYAPSLTSLAFRTTIPVPAGRGGASKGASKAKEVQSAAGKACPTSFERDALEYKKKPEGAPLRFAKRDSNGVCVLEGWCFQRNKDTSMASQWHLNGTSMAPQWHLQWHL